MRRLDAQRTWLLYRGVESFAMSLGWTVAAVFFVTDLGMSPLELVLAGTALEVAYFIFEVPTAIVADTYSRRASIVVGAVIMESLHATGAALVLEDGKVAWPEGRAGEHAVRLPLRWKGRRIGELVCDRDTPFSDDDRALLEAIAHHAAVALEHGRALMCRRRS